MFHPFTFPGLTVANPAKTETSKLNKPDCSRFVLFFHVYPDSNFSVFHLFSPPCKGVHFKDYFFIGCFASSLTRVGLCVSFLGLGNVLANTIELHNY
jgi:hypothetical protein